MSWLGSDDQVKIRQLKVVIVGCLLGASTVLSAAIFEPGVGLGWQYSDNVALSPDDEEVDHGAVGYLGGSLIEEGGPLTYNIGGTVTRQLYANSTFDDQTYFNLGASVRWAQVEDRLNWLVNNFFTQTPINSIGKDVPDNIQNTNVFSIAPDIAFPYSNGHRFQISPFFRDFYYEDTDTDNQQYGLNANWSYPMYPTMRLGINGGITDVNYEQSGSDRDYTRSQLRAFVSGSRPHSEYTLDLGTSRISRDSGNDQSGFGGSLSYLYTITGHSSVRARVATDLTDSSQTFFDSNVNPDDGNSNNVQTSNETFRNNVFTLMYNREGDTFNTQIWGELRDLDYDKSPSDREVQELGADLGYNVNAYLATSLFGSYIRYKETDIGRTDKRYVLGGRVSYSFARNLSANASLQYRKRDSTEAAFEYDEFSALLGVVYGFRGRTTGLVGDTNGRRR
ncbi:MAG: outer membrane beta-barrel protein [Arenicellales bacterium]